MFSFCSSPPRLRSSACSAPQTHHKHVGGACAKSLPLAQPTKTTVLPPPLAIAIERGAKTWILPQDPVCMCVCARPRFCSVCVCNYLTNRKSYHIQARTQLWQLARASDPPVLRWAVQSGEGGGQAGGQQNQHKTWRAYVLTGNVARWRPPLIYISVVVVVVVVAGCMSLHCMKRMCCMLENASSC